MIPLYAYGCFFARTREPPKPAFFGPGTHFDPATQASKAALAVNSAARILASSAPASPAPHRNDIVRAALASSRSSRATTTQ
jgi:hypothetical protein